MSRTPPAPRPALRKAEDGSVHPASPHQSSLVVDPAAVEVAARKAAKGKPARSLTKGSTKAPTKAPTKAKDGGKEAPVELAVTMSKAERKRLRRKAETYGWSAEEAAAHVLRVWADG